MARGAGSRTAESEARTGDGPRAGEGPSLPVVPDDEPVAPPSSRRRSTAIENSRDDFKTLMALTNHVPVLKRVIWRPWRAQIENAFKAVGMDWLLTTTPLNADELSYDGVGRMVLLGKVEGPDQVMIQELATTKKMWDALVTSHEVRTVSQMLELFDQFCGIRRESNEDIRTLAGRIQVLSMELDFCGHAPDELMKIGILFRALGENFRSLRVAVGASNQRGLTLEGLLGQLEAEERSMKWTSGGIGVREQVLFSKGTKGEAGRAKTGPCFKCGQKGHIKKDCNASPEFIRAFERDKLTKRVESLYSEEVDKGARVVRL